MVGGSRQEQKPCKEGSLSIVLREREWRIGLFCHLFYDISLKVLALTDLQEFEKLHLGYL